MNVLSRRQALNEAFKQLQRLPELPQAKEQALQRDGVDGHSSPKRQCSLKFVPFSNRRCIAVVTEEAGPSS
jgi:hypothetical protein